MKNIYLTLVSTALLLPTYASATHIPSHDPNAVSSPNITPLVPSATVPEPSIIALLGVGVAAVFLIKKFKK